MIKNGCTESFCSDFGLPNDAFITWAHENIDKFSVYDFALETIINVWADYGVDAELADCLFKLDFSRLMLPIAIYRNELSSQLLKEKAGLLSVFV